MISWLRKIPFPDHLHTSTEGVIKAEFLGHVSTYENIVSEANRVAESIINSAQIEAEAMRQNVREQVVRSLKNDIQLISDFTAERLENIEAEANQFCFEILSVALTRFIDSSDDLTKIRCLLEDLINHSKSSTLLSISCSPSQELLVNQQLGTILAEQLNFRHWEVIPNSTISDFELRVQAKNGSYIQVSIDNLKAIYEKEIEIFIKSLSSEGVDHD